MNCKEAERDITRFLNYNMDDRDLEGFIEHMETCRSCYEELAIQYLVETGMERLEEGGGFDLTAELAARMKAAKRRITVRRKILDIVLGAVSLGIIGLLLSLLICILF